MEQINDKWKGKYTHVTTILIKPILEIEKYRLRVLS